MSIVPELSVRRGRAAIEFYKAAFGAIEVYRVGGTDENPDVVAQLWRLGRIEDPFGHQWGDRKAARPLATRGRAAPRQPLLAATAGRSVATHSGSPSEGGSGNGLTITVGSVRTRSIVGS